MNTQDAVDLRMMTRCLDLASACVGSRDLPIAALVADGDDVLAESTNAAAATRDVSRHAEIIAMALANAQRDTLDLSGCTLYTLVEPCAMCSFALRECRIGRVVYGLNSPLLGGHSKWSILADGEMGETLRGFFGDPPAVRGGLMAREAEAVFEAWNPIVWSVMKRRGLFAVGAPFADPPSVLQTLADCLMRPAEALVWLRHATRVRR